MPLRAPLLCASLFLVSLGAAEPGGAMLFSSYETFDVSIKAAFDDLFAKAQRNPDYSVPAVVGYTDPQTGEEATIDGVVSVRGRTSKRETECAFPKLKLRFTGEGQGQTASSVFRGMKAIKIGTHCGEQADDDLTERFGRWANEKAPLREAFVYRLLDVFRVRSFKARPARITYVFASGRRLARNGMILEDDREAMKRLGADHEIEPQQFRDAERDFSPADTAKLAFAEAFIGNFDWCLKFFAADTYRCDARRRLWNVFAFAPSNGRAFPVLYDFDIAGMVVGRHRWFPRVFYAGFLESKSAPAIEVTAQVQHTRSVFPRDVLDETRRAFVERKAEAFRALHDADLDADGRSLIETHLTSFFGAIERDDRFYAPVVVRAREPIYLDADRTQPACPQDNGAPAGTLVGPPLRTQGDMIQAAILDVEWRWAPPARCDAVHEGPVWIDRRAIGTDYPKR